MTLREYLTLKSETDLEFAKRSGVSRATLARIHATGEARSASVAAKIVAASGGLISLSDLIHAAPRRKRSAA